MFERDVEYFIDLRNQWLFLTRFATQEQADRLLEMKREREAHEKEGETCLQE